MTKVDLYHEKMELVRHQVEHFLQTELFTWQWWLLLGLSVIPWTLWIIFRDRARQIRLLVGGLFVALVAVIADIIGTQIGLWYYEIKLIPSLPPLLPYDITLMPISFMFILQYAKTKLQWYIVTVLFCIFTAFLVESYLEFIKVYHTDTWKHIYSVPIYFVIFWIGSKISSLKGSV